MICFDNFYDDPDAVRDYALSLDYSRCGVFPGVRTEALHKFDKEFFYRSCHKFLSLFLDLDFEKVEWQILSQFQKIYRYSEDKSSPSNIGWVHSDSDFIKFNGETGAKEAGKLRSEGSEYLVKDGDIMHFRFNV